MTNVSGPGPRGFRNVIGMSFFSLATIGQYLDLLSMWRVRFVLVFVTVSILVTLPSTAHPDIDIQIADVTRQIAEHPTAGGLYLRRAELHRIHKDWPAATADYDRARELDPDLPLWDFYVGGMKLEAGEIEAALVHLNRAVARAPEDPRVRTLRGQILLLHGDPIGAAADYERAIERRVSDQVLPPPELFIARSLALIAAGRAHYDEALRGLEKGLDLLSRPVTLELQALDVEILMGRFDRALSRLDRLESTSARPETWLVRRGEILERAGRFAESRRSYLAAMRRIQALPTPRRESGAMARLEAEARVALERLPANSEDIGSER